MARPEVYGIGDVSPGAREEPRSDLGERRLRRISAWFMLFFLFQGQLGATWDREWHAYVGRDWFWTPPHILIYSCVTGAGLIALGVVLGDTLRYRRGRVGVDATSPNSSGWLRSTAKSEMASPPSAIITATSANT